MDDYPSATTDDPRVPLAAIISDALVGVRAMTVENLHSTGDTEISALVRTADGRAFTLTVRREYARD